MYRSIIRLKDKFRLKYGMMLYRNIFWFSQLFGFSLVRNRFYSPIPEIRTLKDKIWEYPSELIGIKMNEKEQVILLSDFAEKYKIEYDQFQLLKGSNTNPYDFYIKNRCFEEIDGEILYCMIRDLKPRKIIEIGSGYSTYLSARATLKNKENSDDCELIAIEPYPNETLKTGFPGLLKLLQTEVQNVPLAKFLELQENDILFIDSSHVLKIGSDVQYEYLEILPRLNKGVVVHIHDIFLPAEYPKKWVLEELMFYNEQYLLQAFLTFNDSFEILWSGSYMRLKHPDELKKAFNSYEKSTFPGSVWLRKIK
ncbi:MAG: hypothetical protein FD145_29 [Candidatus Saganbacteria bacterium]|uniref:Class I SAM-dependent methyltransferase n=1 Tax=Candidatus Saganbacteria bacterium TaxID=2575572 RepID=A0A833L2D1_UNCSA|nr:MAG: hypothetical protein FD145_29 [Candidatus Saganbacteria bacterium]